MRDCSTTDVPRLSGLKSDTEAHLFAFLHGATKTPKHTAFVIAEA